MIACGLVLGVIKFEAAGAGITHVIGDGCGLLRALLQELGRAWTGVIELFPSKGGHCVGTWLDRGILRRIWVHK